MINNKVNSKGRENGLGQFTWHKVSEEEKEEIKRDAKKLLDDFSKKLEKIKTKEGHFSKDSGMRIEGSGWKTNEDFKDTMFDNAPLVEDDLILAEKGGWKK